MKLISTLTFLLFLLMQFITASCAFPMAKAGEGETDSEYRYF